MAPDTPHYRTLSAQVAARISSEIQAGTWANWLQGERALSESLQVSRKTVRKALAQLQREGQIETADRRGHRILVRDPGDRKAEGSVGLLTPDSLENLRPHTTLWVDELRTLLFENGLRLATFSGRRFFSRQPEKALAKLVEENPQSCWVLAHSRDRIQQWFFEHREPCLIAGSCQPGIPLPNVDLDYFAVCRHAVGAMTRLGHRRLAFFTRQSRRPGDVDSEAGFAEGVQRSVHADVDPIVMRHDDTVEGATRALTRLFNLACPPTAVLVASPIYYLTVVSFLAQRGLCVGRDVSLISRDDDSFLSYLLPRPARYQCSPKTYAKRLFSLVRALAGRESIPQLIQRIEPHFVAGPSLAECPGRI